MFLWRSKGIKQKLQS